ncbi:ATP-grasp domain-containing protein [Bacillus stratosphericus]|uniref:ATP-grasp domain-containing protein n=1 Tax=Bacillus stratosphericus TaxID=293386 RepID=UPI001CFA80FE|nr:ATP-grasp domain-containing protein [Bacillus stratosphericus]
MSEHILLIEEGIILKKEIIDYFTKKGLKITLITEYGTRFENLYDQVITIDLSQWPNLSKILKKLNEEKSFIAVIGFNEPSIGLVNDISNLLNLPVISNYSSQSFRYKDRMRIATEAYGIQTPKYKVIENYEDVYKLSDWKYPLMIKPVSYMGSIGAKKIDTFTQLINYAPRLLNLKFPIFFNDTIHELGAVHNFSNKIIVEEFIEGQEFSVEGFMVNGKYYPLGVTHKFTTNKGYIDELAHIFPADISKELENEIINFAEQVHYALGLQNTLTHIEVKLNNMGDLYLIELGARMGGDNIHRLMNKYFEGFNISELNLLVRSKNPQIKSFKPINPNNHIGIIFFNVPKEYEGKQIKSIEVNNIDCPSITVLETQLFLNPTDEINKGIDWGLERAGFVLVESKDFNAISSFVSEANSYLKIEIL